MKFVWVKECHIPAKIGNDISFCVEETVPDIVLRLHAVTQISGSTDYNIAGMTITTKKIKQKIFEKTKTIIPNEVYQAMGEEK